MKFLIIFALAQILATAGWLQKGYPWVRFAAAQLFQLEATVVGWLLLIPFCLTRAWEVSPTPSIKGCARTIDRWKCSWLRFAFHNPEDGDSGKCALIGPTASDPYMPNAPEWWRAYCWSAWRNSADGLKYRFAWADGPFKRWTLFGRPQHAGWRQENGISVPVISL